VGILLTFTAPASDSDIPVQTLTFSLVGAPAGASITAAGVFTWTPTAAGDYTFDVVVSDGLLTDSETITVSVTGGNIDPVASFTYTNPDNTLGVTVDASASYDPDGSIASYSWNFGDGATATGVTASHTYATPGTWWITLTVTDNGGAVKSTSQEVTVNHHSSPPPTPYVVWGYVYDNVGGPVFGAPVIITDLRTGAVWTTMTDMDYGYYWLDDLNTNETGWTVGDTIQVTVTSGGYTGTGMGIAGSPGNEAYLQVDVYLTTPLSSPIHAASSIVAQTMRIE
jgi:PKD repeat protein